MNRADQIKSLERYNQRAKQQQTTLGRNYDLYLVPVQLPGGVHTDLRVLLPPNFPTEKPQISLLALNFRHPLVGANGDIVNFADIDQWTRASNLGEIVYKLGHRLAEPTPTPAPGTFGPTTTIKTRRLACYHQAFSACCAACLAAGRVDGRFCIELDPSMEVVCRHSAFTAHCGSQQCVVDGASCRVQLRTSSASGSRSPTSSRQPMEVCGATPAQQQQQPVVALPPVPVHFAEIDRLVNDDPDNKLETLMNNDLEFAEFVESLEQYKSVATMLQHLKQENCRQAAENLSYKEALLALQAENQSRRAEVETKLRAFEAKSEEQNQIINRLSVATVLSKLQTESQQASLRCDTASDAVYNSSSSSLKAATQEFLQQRTRYHQLCAMREILEQRGVQQLLSASTSVIR
eukprot:gnl/Spiro4/13868_TR7408_c0_g1_i1.p1 gnl/Spiro4/13868_TR7408_c0_g1~~gnl/Spiro4/13868_TR7408_c0_g1_i1.p1  ORF type:complete len:406 (+),score=124.04 gnl/Spiro4/13868_TR7408_c0_g1_i1:69-1286(+)